MRIIGVIPSRYQSSRFPGKPLAMIKGQSLIERVWRQAKKCRNLDDVIVATDDQRIQFCAQSFGARVVMTSPECSSGTDRIAEVAEKAEKKAGLFINIQGDEPLIPPKLIDNVAFALKKSKGVPVVTAVFPLKNINEINSPNVAKVVLDEKGYAMFFSRSVIPYVRSGTFENYYKHIGIYGYTREFLKKFSSWGATPAEKAEQLEQLRILEKGCRIKTVISDSDSFGVDVPGDITKIENLLK